MYEVCGDSGCSKCEPDMFEDATQIDKVETQHIHQQLYAKTDTKQYEGCYNWRKGRRWGFSVHCMSSQSVNYR